jgi:ribosomal protein S12 methylthiotransferase accessory factor
VQRDFWAEPSSLDRKNLSAPKRFLYGTHRTESPERTLQAALAVARAIGVTRFADITHLDRVGIPTVLAVRPGGGWLSVDGGKGITTTLATVSAAMECIERHHAETARVSAFRATWAELRARDAVPPAEDLLLARGSLFRPDVAERWAWCWDVAGDQPLAVPHAAVGAQPRRRGWEGDPLNHQVTSNGLASGNHLLEAICAGLYEVVERDATSCWGARIRRGAVLRRVEPAGLEDAIVDEAVARFEAADVEPLLFDITSDIAIPTFAAYAFDRRARHVGYFRGFGTHLDPRVAAARALTEAAQCRAIIVAGSRDDIFWAELLRSRRGDDHRWYDRLRSSPLDVAAGDYADASTPTFEGDLEAGIRRLADAGLSRIGVLDLTQPEHGLPVVRVFVPGLEGCDGISLYRAGHRARAFAVA